MTKDKIYVIDSNTNKVDSYYTLGAISDNSNDVLCIQSEIYIDGNSASPFSTKDLVTKAFNLESFLSISNFEIRTASSLKKKIQPKQPYKLKIGSVVTYKNKSYEVVGFYYNRFAQLNIVTPILFNPENIVADALNLFYGLKDDFEVQELINKNFKEGKYNEDFKFPLTFGITDFKKELTNIIQPPFTTLDTFDIKTTQKDSDGNIFLEPYKLNNNLIDKDHIETTLLRNNLPKEGNEVNSFADLREKSELISPIDLTRTSSTAFRTQFPIYGLKLDDKTNLPYNFVNRIDLENEVEQYAYNTNIGKILPILKTGFYKGGRFNRTETNTLFEKPFVFGISQGGNVISHRFLSSFLFTTNGAEKNYMSINENSKTFFNDNYNSFSGYDDEDLYSSYLTLEEDEYYGTYYNSSGNVNKNKFTDAEILPFGTVFKKNGIYYYVLKYLFSDKTDYCIALKCSTRKKILPLGLSFDSLSKLNENLKKFTKKEVANAYKKEGRIFSLPSSLFSKRTDIKPKKDDRPSIITDVFLDKRKEQIEVIKENFPKLNDTIFGILSLLDKSISSSKKEEIITDKNAVFINLIPNRNTFRSSFKSEDFLKKVEKTWEDKVGFLVEIIANSGVKLKDKIYELATNTSYVNLIRENLFFKVKNWKDAQQYYLIRYAINVFKNLEVAEDGLSEDEFPFQNYFLTFSGDCFVSSFPDLRIYTINKTLRVKSEETLTDIAIYKEQNDRTDYIKIAQSILVINILNILFRYAPMVLQAYRNGKREEFLSNTNILNLIRKYDYAIDFKYLLDNITDLTFRIDTNLYYDFDDYDFKEYQESVKVFRNGYDFDLVEQSGKNAFIELLKQIDFLYGYQFSLEEKIINNTDKKILKSFFEEEKQKPKLQPKEDDIDIDDIFDDALEDLGDDFFDDINNIDIDEF